MVGDLISLELQIARLVAKGRDRCLWKVDMQVAD
jgi:hypothetical protein